MTGNRRNAGPFATKSSIICSSSLALVRPRSRIRMCRKAQSFKRKRIHRASTEEKMKRRFSISEVLIRNKDGEELERKDLEAEAAAALKACRPNSALTVREVQEDAHRIIDSGYFFSCMPAAVDTRDGIRLIFQVEPNQEFQRLICEGASALSLKFLEDAFHDGYGKVINIWSLDEVISSING